jgi:Domain of unknown function (DUF4359)
MAILKPRLNQLLLGVTIAAVTALAAVTNPGPEAHGQFAYGLASRYLQEDLCNQDLPIVGRRFAEDCKTLVATPEVQGQIKDLLIKSSDRQNFGLFSLYQTQLSLQELVPMIPKSMVPPYRVEAVGLFGQFFVYQAGPPASATSN